MPGGMTIFYSLAHLISIRTQVENGLLSCHVGVRWVTRSERSPRDVQSIVFYCIHNSEASLWVVSREDYNLNRFFVSIDLVEPKQPLNERKCRPGCWRVCSLLFLVPKERLKSLRPVHCVGFLQVKQCC